MKVTIRPLEEKDAYTSVKWRNIPEVWTYTAYTPTREITIDDELAWIRKVIADTSCRRFAIMVDSLYVGNIYLTDIKDAEAEYSIFIGDKNYWGKGIAKKASEQIIDYGKDILKLKSIKLGVNENNLPALHIYNSLGFKKFSEDDKFTWMRLNLRNWGTE